MKLPWKLPIRPQWQSWLELHPGDDWLLQLPFFFALKDRGTELEILYVCGGGGGGGRGGGPF